MNLYEQYLLPNGLTLEVFDLSQPIAADTMKVALLIRIRVALRPDYFAEPAQFQETRAIFGPEIPFEYRMGRSFVSNEEKASVFNSLLNTFKQDTLPYLSSAKFPGRFALSRYREILKHPYKYRIRTEPA
jgi:hypothetical protein